MKRIFALVIVVLCLTIQSNAMIINFDDLAANINDGYGMLYNEIPLNYQGLTWEPHNIVSGWNVNNGNTYKTVYKNSYGAVSPINFASNSGASLVTVTGPMFNFDGAYFSTWAMNNAFQSWSATSITVKGYNGTSLVGTATLSLSSNSFKWLDAGFQNITKLEITGGSGKYWTMDDFTIPEPATICVLSLGFLGILRKKMR